MHTLSGRDTGSGDYCEYGVFVRCVERRSAAAMAPGLRPPAPLTAVLDKKPSSRAHVTATNVNTNRPPGHDQWLRRYTLTLPVGIEGTRRKELQRKLAEKHRAAGEHYRAGWRGDEHPLGAELRFLPRQAVNHLDNAGQVVDRSHRDLPLNRRNVLRLLPERRCLDGERGWRHPRIQTLAGYSIPSRSTIAAQYVMDNGGQQRQLHHLNPFPNPDAVQGSASRPAFDAQYGRGVGGVVNVVHARARTCSMGACSNICAITS